MAFGAIMLCVLLSESYNFDDHGSYRCTENKIGANAGQIPPSQGQADIIAVYAEEGTTDQTRNQRQLIG